MDKKRLRVARVDHRGMNYVEEGQLPLAPTTILTLNVKDPALQCSLFQVQDTLDSSNVGFVGHCRIGQQCQTGCHLPLKCVWTD